MSTPNAPTTGNNSEPSSSVSNSVARGQWKIGALLLTVAIVAQASLWTYWWEDPTHFKMSILFVWPAAIFFLAIWWTFFSGWSEVIRFGSMGFAATGVILFFSIFRLDKFDGDMVPHRVVPFWVRSSDDELTQFLSQHKPDTSTAESTAPATEPLIEQEGDWPGYRGPGRNGMVRGIPLKADWSAKPPRAIWRHPVGKGWSSFAVIGDMAFTQEQRDTREAVVAYSLSTGQQVWEHVDEVKFQALEGQGGAGPRATPQFNDGNLYTQGATGILNCLDAATGRRIWSTDVLKNAGSDGTPAPNLGWGTASSPLVVDQLVIVNPGGADGKSVIAYYKLTGQRAWSGGSHPASYGSPCIETLLGEPVILVPLADGLGGHSFADGRELWHFPWANGAQVNAAQPVVVADGSLVFGCGYGVGTVRLDLKRSGEAWTVTQQWHTSRFFPKFNDYVKLGDHIYGLSDGTLTCIEVATGKTKWKSGRYGYGQLLLVDETLLILSESGRVVLVPATPTRPDELSSFQALNSDDITWNHPVLVRGKLLVRNGIEAACYEID